MGFERYGTAAALLLLVAPSAAHAEPLSPHVDLIAFEPGNPRHAVIEDIAYGLFETEDGGATFSYVCPAAYGGTTDPGSFHPIALLPDGRTVVAVDFDGLHIGAPGLCSFAKREVPGVEPWDVVTSPAGDVVYVVSAEVTDASISGFILRSVDGLRTFQPLGAVPGGVIPLRLGVAPSDPRRMYVLAAHRDSSYVILRSGDAGATWETLPAPPVAPPSYLRSIVVNPVDPDVFFTVATLLSDAPAPALWVSFDAGATHLEVQTGIVTGFPGSNKPFPGVTFSPDGTEAAFGDPGGLWHADVAALRRDPRSVEKYSDGSFGALTWTPDGLYAGGSRFGLEPSSQFTLAVSHDGGRHFSPVFDVCETVLGCGNTGGPAECATLVSHLRVDLLDGVACTSPSTPEPLPVVDGGAADAGPRRTQTDFNAQGVSKGSGCACVVGRAVSGREPRLAWLVAAAAVGASRRRRRMRRTSGVVARDG